MYMVFDKDGCVGVYDGDDELMDALESIADVTVIDGKATPDRLTAFYLTVDSPPNPNAFCDLDHDTQCSILERFMNEPIDQMAEWSLAMFDDLDGMITEDDIDEFERHEHVVRSWVDERLDRESFEAIDCGDVIETYEDGLVRYVEESMVAQSQ